MKHDEILKPEVFLAIPWYLSRYCRPLRISSTILHIIYFLNNSASWVYNASQNSILLSYAGTFLCCSMDYPYWLKNPRQPRLYFLYTCAHVIIMRCKMQGLQVPYLSDSNVWHRYLINWYTLLFSVIYLRFGISRFFFLRQVRADGFHPYTLSQNEG